MARIENGRQSVDTRSIRTISSSRIDDESSFGSDSEINGFTSERQTDKYGFIGGAQMYTEGSAQDVPTEVLRQREVKWLDMLSHWDKWMIKRFNKDAFWGLVQICEKYLPGYYSPGLEAIQLDGEILFALLRRVSPLAFRHLEKHKIDPILYMTEWFMCAFSRTLPWASVLRVWDMILCDGVKIIFRVGLVLLKCMLGSREKLKACQGQYETMELLRAIEPRYMQEGFLVREIIEIPVTARDVEREHHSQLKRWKKNRGELNFKSPPRMHGARLIMLAEPPRRQDLQQNPTIVIEVAQPAAQLNKGKEEKKSKKKKSIKKSQLTEETPNPYPLLTDSPPPPPSDPPAPPPPSDPPAPPPVRSETPETAPQTEPDSPHQQQAPPTVPPPAKESPLQRSTQSLSSTEQDTYL
ncbi:TBC1 domain family member 10A-like [Scomber scombrus]|uniref:TBC1 domain family member 10A-like n=1 Tax=Scomber scombrus TaxID=13677 RepID=A0AAV1MTD4_SCOSC